MTETTIRAARPDDAADIQAIYAPIVAETPISFEVEVPGVEEMARRIRTISETHVYLAAERDGRVIGYAYGSTHRAREAYFPSAEVTVYVSEAARGQGLGRKLYEDLLPKLAAKGFHAAFAGITLPNDASVAVHEAVGFTKIGVFREVGRKFGQWHDVGWWQRLL